jgi:arylsulfatase A-like enzyme
VRPNVLFVTLDQFRADCLSAAGHPIVRTPNLDSLAAEGVRFARHYSQATPCGPGRASLYTGMYQLNHRVVGNGTPLDARFDTVALAARRVGYEPALFGYTDQTVDPRQAAGPDDPRLTTYNGILPGFDAILDIPDDLAGNPRLRRHAGADGDARDRTRPSGTTQRRGVPHRPCDRLDRRAGRTVVRPPELPAPAPAVRRSR